MALLLKHIKMVKVKNFMFKAEMLDGGAAAAGGQAAAC